VFGELHEEGTISSSFSTPKTTLSGYDSPTEELDTPTPFAPRSSPLPSPLFPPRRSQSQSQSTGIKSNEVSPGLGSESFARRASANASGSVRKWQPGEKQRRSLSVATPSI
jgi:hypothetical protein